MKYREEEKTLVEYLKEKLKTRGILKFPRDWHLRNLAVARTMLEGDNAPSTQEWQKCINWAFAHKFWGDKVDHLARVFALWPQYVLQTRKGNRETDQSQERKRELIQKLYLS
jgi:hypothetical protein